MASIHSFDVFDTVLTRKVGRPESVFLLLGNLLVRDDVIKISAERFAWMRMEAERRSFSNHGGLDSKVNLDTIYHELSRAMYLSPQAAAEIQDRELKLERELLCPIPQTAKKYGLSREQHARVIYISDMYCDPDFLEGVLKENGLFSSSDKLYLSNRFGRSKHGGSLYSLVAREEAVAPSGITHHGNDFYSDVKAARKKGVGGIHFPEGNLNRFEKLMESFSWKTGGLASAMAGASRCARLEVYEESAHERALRRVAGGVAAPFLVGFTLWILRRAEQMGLKTLYYVSREGQIMREISSRLAVKLGLDIRAEYVRTSRQAWLLPVAGNIGESWLESLMLSGTDADYLSPEILFSRLNISRGEARPVLEDVGFPDDAWPQSMKIEQRRELLAALAGSETFSRLIAAKAAEAREQALAYLAEAGMLNEEVIGMVDLGTGASLHNALQTMLDFPDAPKLHSFYLALRKIPETVVQAPEPYLFNRCDRTGYFGADGIVTFLEAVCGADHGTVTGYEKRAEGVIAKLQKEDNPEVMNWGIPQIRDAVFSFIEHLHLDPEAMDLDADLRPMLEKLHNTFWKNPDRDEAEAWGAFPFEDGWGEKCSSVPLCTSYRLTDTPKMLSAYLSNGRVRHGHWWHEGAMAMTAPWLRCVIHYSVKGKRLARRVLKK